MTWSRGTGGGSAVDSSQMLTLDNLLSVLGSQNVGGYAISAVTTGPANWGAQEPLAVVDASSGVGSDTDGYYLEQTSGASAGSDMFLRSSAISTWVHRPLLTIKAGLPDLTDVRAFFMISGFFAPSTLDDPTVSRAGFSYSSARADTNWQATLKPTNLGTETIVDTGVPVTTDAFVFVIDRVDATSIKLSIWNADMSTELWTQTFSGAEVPATTENAVLFSGGETVAASARSVRQYGGSVSRRGLAS